MLLMPNDVKYFWNMKAPTQKNENHKRKRVSDIKWNKASKLSSLRLKTSFWTFSNLLGFLIVFQSQPLFYSRKQTVLYTDLKTQWPINPSTVVLTEKFFQNIILIFCLTSNLLSLLFMLDIVIGHLIINFHQKFRSEKVTTKGHIVWENHFLNLFHNIKSIFVNLAHSFQPLNEAHKQFH